MLAYISDLFGVFRVLVFLCSCIILALISAGLLGADISDEVVAETHDTKEEPTTEVKKEEVEESRLDTALSSDNHIRIIGALVFILFLTRHDSMLILVFFPLLFAAFRLFGRCFKLDLIFSQFTGP